MENVEYGQKVDKDEITRELTSVFEDTQLVMINSAQVAPVNRRRLYWTNIPMLEFLNLLKSITKTLLLMDTLIRIKRMFC